MIEQGNLSQDYFDKIREELHGLPGYVAKQSTIVTSREFLQPPSTWIIETVKTDEHGALFIQAINSTGSVRLVIPQKVVERIISQHNAITKERYKIRGQRAHATRLSNILEDDLKSMEDQDFNRINNTQNL
jgi:hypothetical protein